ncbi:MAG TPA: M48 family peptidase, partial [Rhodocyclaceae bacterium]|nr:M48 family peptidase [Rhodocyclaceae bacterium]
MASSFTLIFLAAVVLTLAARLWLALRQMNYVQSNRDQVPALFSERIQLSAHQKAADYTVARTKLGMQSALVETALLLALTLGGGIAALHGFWSPRLDGLWYGVAMIFSLMLISGLVDLPFSLYRQFVVEERFGFNRMTPGLFLS